jgi:signal transduction histidine kinase
MNNATSPDSAATEFSLSQLSSMFSSVLLIEDEQAHAYLITRTLKPLLSNITHVGSGERGVDAVLSSYFDLVICDLNIPDKHGFEIVREISRLRPSLPIIVMTSSTNLADAIQAMQEGAWDYVVKQFSGSFFDSMQLVLQRTANRVHQQMRELELRSERKNFWAAAHSAQDGLAIIGSQGLVVFANTAFWNFAKLISKDAESTQPLNIAELVTIADEKVGFALKGQFQGGRSELLWNSELKLGERYYDLSLSSVKLEEIDEKAFSRFVLWVRDITRRKNQEKLQRELLSTTSHDLKGPLGAILTSAELLTDPNFLRSKKGEELITRIASCARNSISIIDELLSARRIQDGLLIVKPREINLAEVIEEIILDYQPLSKAKQMTFIGDAESPDTTIYADKIGLHRVLGNLISNAIKFTPAGGKVEIRGRKVPGGTEISVSDTGRGIEPTLRHQLFEKYARLDEHQEVEGTGLGLFVTKNIVDAHGGKVEITSEVGVGTTFTLLFPDHQGTSLPAEQPS